MESGQKVTRKCVLETVEDVRAWLSKPENQIKTGLFVIKWEGATPLISIWPVNRLTDLMNDRLFALVVLEQHVIRKRGATPLGE